MITLALKCQNKCQNKQSLTDLFWIWIQQEIRFPRVVTNCCRFLCYFCRISRQNQRSMFDHLSYLLQNSGIGLGECLFALFVLWCIFQGDLFSVGALFELQNLYFLFAGMRGSTPLDVAAASCIDNNELALALQEQDLEMVKTFDISKAIILISYGYCSRFKCANMFQGCEVFGWMWTSELPNATGKRLPWYRMESLRWREIPWLSSICCVCQWSDLCFDAKTIS